MTGPAGGNPRKRKGGSGGGGEGQRGNGKKARGGGGGGGWSGSSNRYSYRQRSGEIRGPGIWFTCERNKEARAVAEAYDLLDEKADELWPETAAGAGAVAAPAGLNNGNMDDDQEDSDAEEESIEDAIARELASLKPQGKGKGASSSQAGKATKPRFSNVKTNTECLAWISCRYPCDPVKLVQGIVKDLQDGAPTRTKVLQRMTPVSATAHADVDSLQRIAYNVLESTFAPQGYTMEQRDRDPVIAYRIEPQLRNHSGSLNRDKINQIIGGVIQDLVNPTFQYSEPGSKEPVPSIPEGTPKEADPIAATTGTETEIVAEVEVQTAEPEIIATELPAGGEQVEGQPESKPERPPRPPLPPFRRRARVNLKNPTHTILVSALKGVCGISIVTGYDGEGKRFNVQTLSGGGELSGRGQAQSVQKVEEDGQQKEKAGKIKLQDELEAEQQRAEEDYHAAAAAAAAAATKPEEGPPAE